MPTPATEIAVLPLKPDVTIEDVLTPPGQVFNQVLKTIKSQQGFQRQSWGRQLENQNHLVLAIDWDDVSYHKAFTQSPSYQTFFEEVTPILDLSPTASMPPNVIHVNFVPHPPIGTTPTPVTELAFFALPANASTSQKSALEDAVLNLAKVCTPTTVKSSDAPPSAPPAQSFATGWVLEEMDRHAGTEGKAISFALMLGWESKDAHMGFKEGSAAFGEAIKPVREMTLPPEPGKNLYHVGFSSGEVAG